jgi:transposase
MITTMRSDPNAAPPRVEVITSVQRRRRWSAAEKVRLVEETIQPGMSVSYVARRGPRRPVGLEERLQRHPPAQCARQSDAD